MVIRTSPRAWSMPAAMAAVWPALRRNLTSRRSGSVRGSSRQRSKVRSLLPSSTNTISVRRPSGRTAVADRLVQEMDIVLLVVERHDDRQVAAQCSARVERRFGQIIAALRPWRPGIDRHLQHEQQPRLSANIGITVRDQAHGECLGRPDADQPEDPRSPPARPTPHPSGATGTRTGSIYRVIPRRKRLASPALRYGWRCCKSAAFRHGEHQPLAGSPAQMPSHSKARTRADTALSAGATENLGGCVAFQSTLP